jgi:large subunit ribosomal protein L23
MACEKGGGVTMKFVLVTPRATEKAYRLVSGQNTYVFNVPVGSNKNEIVAAVEAQYEGTKVSSIKTVVQSGKSVRFSRGKNRYPGTTTRKDSKKAYVTLSEGAIKVFETQEQTQDSKGEKK